MPAQCQKFVGNAWKKDLCSNCFKCEAEHGQPAAPAAAAPADDQENCHRSLSGQDSLTELQKGANRYLSVATSHYSYSSSRYAKQLNKWNDTAFGDSLGGDRSSFESTRLVQSATQREQQAVGAQAKASQHGEAAGDGLSSAQLVLQSVVTSAAGPSASSRASEVSQPDSEVDMTSSHNVIQRLDSLVLGNPLGSLESGQPANGSDGQPSSITGILKDTSGGKEKPSGEKKRSITFPDYEELQEIIGYGGETFYSSDEEEPVKEFEKSRSDKDYIEELTPEERNMLNLTKKNTTFNAHAQNLKNPNASPPPRLGVDKKHTPMVSVRPFVRELTPGKVNKVSPMINGELVTNRSKESCKPGDGKIFSPVRKMSMEEGGGRGEMKTRKKDSLGSDGSSENSSDSESNNRDSPSPDTSHLQLGNKDSSTAKPSVSSHSRQTSFLHSHLIGNDQQKSNSKSSAASARLSFLNSTIGETLKLESEPSQMANRPEKERELPVMETQAEKQEVFKVSVPVDDKEPAVSTVKEEEEEECDKSSSEVDKASPKVKLTRKSPYVVGPYASTAILKGTPKPMITRKPPILKDKPKVPVKPNKLLRRSPSTSPAQSPKLARKVSVEDHKAAGSINQKAPTDAHSSVPAARQTRKSPVAAPRKSSFRQQQQPAGEYVNFSLPVAAKQSKDEDGDRSGLDVVCDVKKGIDSHPPGLVIEVSSSGLGQATDPAARQQKEAEQSPEAVSKTGGGNAVADGNSSNSRREHSPPVVQKNLASKNKEALEAIRKSLSNKLISMAPPARVTESIKASECGGDVGTGGGGTSKTAVHKTMSNSFEETRASIAEALEFNRHDKVSRPSTKRQAPKPPAEEDGDGDGEGEAAEEEKEEVAADKQDEQEAQEVKESVSPDKTDSSSSSSSPSEPKLTPAIRNSSMKSENSSRPRDSKPRSVQFNPETTTVTVPSNLNPTPKVISYDRWMGKGHMSSSYLESSFTGQPITMLPPGTISSPMKKPIPAGINYAPTPIIDDGPRKWTEKKNKWRSKSTPRSTEIDEIIGSSKTKKVNRLGIFSPSSPQPIRRQSRVEIYEAEKRLQKKGKFSLKKLFKVQPAGEPAEEGSASGGSPANNKFIDKEHEREILERQKAKFRPEIIHPLDLQNVGVEIVKITPKVGVKGHYNKHGKASSRSGEKSAVKRQAELKTKIDLTENKDSGHDTSSIHTETSEGTSSSTGELSHSSTEFWHGPTPVGVVDQPKPSGGLGSSWREISSSQTSLGVNSAGRPKPLPPPRSHSLEVIEDKKLTTEVSFSPEAGSKNEAAATAASPAHQRSPSTPEKTVYANLGPMRSSLAPNKPQRTASLREANNAEDGGQAVEPKVVVTSGGGGASGQYITPGRMNIGNVSVPSPTSAHLVPFHVKTSSLTGSINSESDTTSCPSSSVRKARDGSEADSERDSVSPQRLQEEVLLGDDESPVSSSNRKRMSRLSMRKGRSIVHKNLEDNYGAVISANHEALAQILEQVCQNRPTPTALRSLAAAMNLRFADFSVLSESEGLRTRKRAFFPATWGSSHLPVTLMVSRDMTLNNTSTKNSFSLTPIAQFVDQVPSYLLSARPESDSSPHINSQAVVWALSRQQSILTFETFARNLKQRRKSIRLDEWEKDMSFVLLQLINGLKFLQAQGIEETVACLDNFLLARSDNDTNNRLIITEECHARGQERSMSLCQCALAAMLQLFDLPDPVGLACRRQEKIELPQIIPSVSMFSTMAVILQKDESMSLGQVKSMLEYMLWGPSDIIFEMKSGREAESREQALQHWLDLERANVLNNLIRTQGLWNIQLSVYEEYHLLFLTMTCAKTLCEASLLFESEVSRM